MSLRVLFLTESFHPVLGGGEQHIRTLAGRLVAGGITATVVTRRIQGEWPAEERLDGIRVVRVAPEGHGRIGKYGMVLPALDALRRERAGHDVVVVRGTRVLGLPGLLAARALAKAVVLQPELNGEMSGEVYTWGTPLAAPLPRRLVGASVALRNLLLRDADAFVAMSLLIREELVAAGVPSERVAWIPHGVDTERFRPVAAGERQALRERFGLPAAARIVVYTGRLLKGKGLDTLLDAFTKVAALDAEAHLLLVGSGAGQTLSIEEELRARAASSGLAGRVTFSGRVEAVEDYLKASDLFAFPSVFEALGISLVEAAACGLPAVGSRTGGIVDVIADGVSGLLVTPGSVAELEQGLLALLGDAPRRRQMGDEARRIACRRFDLGASVERYRRLFHELAFSSRSRSWTSRAPRAGATPPR